MLSTTAQFPVVPAGDDWQVVDFISDLHLQSGEPATARVWAQYMQATPADALFILGDLFEVWIGDDTRDPFALACIAVIRQTANRLPIYFLCGNRDFLLGPHMHQISGMQALSDPAVVTLGQHRFLLSHGDALCLDDVDYLQFRHQVRQASWQQDFLSKPLAERQTIARGLRTQSEARKQTTRDYADVDTAAALAWLQQSNCHTLIHGHTHRPATHTLTAGYQRWCLSDWHAEGPAPRLEVLSWLRAQDNGPAQGLQRSALAA